MFLSICAPVKSDAISIPMSSTPRVKVPLLNSFTISAATSSAKSVASANSTDNSADTAFANVLGVS